MDNLGRCSISLGLQPLDIYSVVKVAREGAELFIDHDCRTIVRESRKVVETALSGETLIYGLNTGLGHRRDTRVPNDLLRLYQTRIVQTHAGAVGRPLSEPTVRAIMLARIVGIVRGGSGITEKTMDALLAMLNAGVHPVVPEFGSVGASDLQTMASVAQVLVGEGSATYGGQTLDGRDALARAGLEPIILEPKEGLALVSCNGLAIGGGALAVDRLRRTMNLADVAGTLSLEAIDGNIGPLAANIQKAKAYPEQIAVATHQRNLLQGSYLKAPSEGRSVQDALSFRTLPQVHGAVVRQINFVAEAVEIELNSRSDNPLVDVEEGRMISNGNFQPLSLALGFDAQRVGLAHVAMLSERRSNHLFGMLMELRSLDGSPNGDATGLIAYSAAEIASRIKLLASPASIHLPSLAHDVEDHGSLGPSTVAFTEQSLDLLELVLSIEIVLATIVIDSTKKGTLGEGTSRAYKMASIAFGAFEKQDSGGVVEKLREMLASENW